MNHIATLILSSSALALAAAAPAHAQDAAPLPADANDIIVTGQRASLEAARNVKRNSDLVVDSIVAEDIGKLPDTSVASALQRIAGVQVQNGFNNEIQNPIIRGIGDILTTLDGREIFTGVGRGFSFQDLPAEAIGGIDVYKSNSANLIEGGVAGVIDMKLQKPFNFSKGLTVAANGRVYHGDVSDKTSYTGGVLVSNRWDAGDGEMGLLVDVSYGRNNFSRPVSFNCDPRSANHGPPGATDMVLPTCVGGTTDTGHNTRPQVNAAFQWEITPELQVYVDGLYTGYRSKFATNFIFADLFAGNSITNAVAGSDCFSAHVNGAGFNGSSTDPVENLCLGQSATFNGVDELTSTQAKKQRTDQYVLGGGVKWDTDTAHLVFDASYIQSKNSNRTIIVDVAKHNGTVNVIVDDNGHGTTVMEGDPLSNPDGFVFANTLFQDLNKSNSRQYAFKLDSTFDIDSDVLREFQAGVRYSDRKGSFRAVAGGPPFPGPDRGTLVSSVGLPSDFMVRSPDSIPYINNGSHWYTPNADYLLNNTDELRALYGAPAGDPAWDPTRNYDASEKTWAAYVQGKYQIDLGDTALIDGLVGVRVVSTRRTLDGTSRVIGGAPDGGDLFVPVSRDTSDVYALPNASIRFRATPQLQFRANYAKTMARPTFGDLNPGLSLAAPGGNPNVTLAGSGGNPDLKAQLSDNFDVTAEYYFGRSSYVSIAGYYRKLKDRVASSTSIQTIDGYRYEITQPRNVGSSKLKGVEVAGQMFFDFLPEGFDGLGAMGTFTLADSKVTTPGDLLEGERLLGVSKYNYTAGALYEKYGVTARVVYTWRSGYNETLFGAGTLAGPDTTSQFNKVKSNGRLDFSIGYDVTPNITVTVDGVNVTGGKYYSYFDNPAFPHDIRIDDKFYGASIRVKY
ncbi:TonB-dependent receptor [Edaphosphingomonas haloaromaticamans]|uniref:TonB dependent receptor n=1 Tax=Edaphosphingomonas haloaromaticamans TaxID=653954 RepID=A0A1S1HEK6_9SPHN|nr:TonB-dependent receptor [Sphingomonas haloaromaticamans]OHT20624.1 TonB dependent receptor [Sphingomonas haloaromaticamans]